MSEQSPHQGGLPLSHPLRAQWASYKSSVDYLRAKAEFPHSEYARAEASARADRLLWPIYQAGWDFACLQNRTRETQPDRELVVIVVGALASAFALGALVGWGLL